MAVALVGGIRAPLGTLSSWICMKIHFVGTNCRGGASELAYLFHQKQSPQNISPYISTNLFCHTCFQHGVCFICACLRFCLFPLPLGVWEGLWRVIVTLPRLFSYFILNNVVREIKDHIYALGQYPLSKRYKLRSVCRLATLASSLS